MSVYPERRSGRLTGKWIAEVTQGGERRRKRFETKHEGERWADYIKRTGTLPPVEATIVPPDVQHPFGDVVKEALERHEGWEGNRDPSRNQRLTYAVDLIGKDKAIAAIDTADLDKLVADLKKRPGVGGKRLSAGTINRYLSLVSAVMSYARKRGYRKDTPDVPWRKEAGRRIHWLTNEAEEALCKLIASEGRHDEVITVRVLTATGMRWGEFETLTREQVTDRWVKLTKTKTDTPRDIPIDPKMAEALRDMLKRGARPPYYTFRDTLKRALKNAGQNEGLSVHGLRHTTATRLVLSGVNLAVVQKFMGHSSINTTLKYTHVTENALQEALEKISPRAGHGAENSNVINFPTIDNAKVMEATPGIEPGYTVLQTDL